MAPPSFIVGIGGSAGGLEAYRDLLDALPPSTGMAFVIVAHLLPTASSQLATILSRHTKMNVSVASMGMPILGNHVYVIPPDADILIDRYAFKVISPRAVPNKQIDVFFTSLAESMGTHAIGIILSGYDGDGTEGCKQIKAKGGITFSQDLSAAVADMPRSASASGSIDFVLPPDKIADELQRMARAGVRNG
jgi:two-component system CheB/CheR fusion protein